jgi:uncharacterized membrane protein YhhN
VAITWKEGRLMLSGLILVSGLVYLWAEARHHQSVLYVLKPGTMALIICLAVTGLAQQRAAGYAYAVVAGLAVSVVGDVLLMLPRERFIGGLAAFLVAHLLYIWGLWFGLSAQPVVMDLVIPPVLALLGGFVFRRLSRGIREQGQEAMLVPVGVYAAAITIMAWRAAVVLFQPGALPVYRWLPALGAALFYLSDTALAWDRFVRPLPRRNLIIMATYFAAQYCFAASVAFMPGA